MHCVIVLATLFVTSSYWSAVLAKTISPEVFDQLKITLTNSTESLDPPLNSVRELKWDQPIQLLSRCWCDFTRTPFFDNFDVRAWERDSILAHPVPAPPELLPPPRLRCPAVIWTPVPDRFPTSVQVAKTPLRISHGDF